MKKPYLPINLEKISTYSLLGRDNKVNIAEHFAAIPTADSSFRTFYDSLPNLLGAESLRAVVTAIINAHQKQRPVVLAMGGHVIKCGLQRRITRHP